VKLGFYETVDTTAGPISFYVNDTLNPLAAQPGPLYTALRCASVVGSDFDSVPFWHHDTLNTAQWRPPNNPPGIFTCIGFYAPLPPSLGGSGWADGWGTGNEPTLDFFYHP
jgi:hypothetical protein